MVRNTQPINNNNWAHKQQITILLRRPKAISFPLMQYYDMTGLGSLVLIRNLCGKADTCLGGISVYVYTNADDNEIQYYVDTLVPILI